MSFYLQYLYVAGLLPAEAPAGNLMGYVMGKAEGEGELWHGHVTAVTVAPEFDVVGRKLMNWKDVGAVFDGASSTCSCASRIAGHRHVRGVRLFRFRRVWGITRDGGRRHAEARPRTRRRSRWCRCGILFCRRTSGDGACLVVVAWRGEWATVMMHTVACAPTVTPARARRALPLPRWVAIARAPLLLGGFFPWW